ncbi:MAG TPA: hypothetical protein VD902_12210 [Symbiobacteriaceae bacterium]|nr:hypothetical protein [Symbiobacteriaceae bacterium]
MEDLFGVLIFLVFVGVSLVGRFLKSQQGQQGQQGQQPKWPGPVANPPRGTPKPTWAPPAPPRPQSQPRPGRQQQPAPGGQPRREPVPRDISGEGVGTEGAWSGMEGPGAGDRVYEAANRFSQESDQIARHSLGEVYEDTGGRHLHRLQDELVRPGDEAAVVTPGESTAWNLQPAMASRDSLAQAVVLAEVLGKPKALRKGHRA